MASIAKDEHGIYHLTVGTEVSAKYRGAFCEAQIKSLKKNVQYKVVSKKMGKSFQLSEENIRGLLKIGSHVEAQFPDQPFWQDSIIQNAKDKSSYTVVFDDGDERTLSRGSLCLKGDRHYAKSETLDNLPLTDPENFGTPVLGSKKNRRRRPPEEEYEGESEDHKTPDRETAKAKEKKQNESIEQPQQETSSEDDEDEDEKRTRWLADPFMGKVVIVEPNDKRKHWFPGLVVNPLCYERHKDISVNHLAVRSFKTGKFLRVNRANVKEMSLATIPPKLDSTWKGIVDDALNWQKMKTVSERWRMDIKEILNDSDDNDSSDEEGKTKKKDEKKLTNSTIENDPEEKEQEKKSHDFLEVLYKFMDDRGSPINKTPVLGYKDLDLFLLFNLVEKRQLKFSAISIKEWKQIYLDLGIPKSNPAAGHNVKTAYMKYLGSYEEYCASWKFASPAKKTVKSPSLPGIKEKKKFKVEKSAKPSQDARKMKSKDNLPRIKSMDSGVDSKTRGRSSPVAVASSTDSALPQQRRSGQRRRASESSSASDVTLPSSSSKADTKKTTKGSQVKKSDEIFRSPGGPDSEPDENSRSVKTEKKEAGDKRPAQKLTADSSAAKRIRRNSTSNLSTQYSVGDRLKVKYGQGKTFKIYDAKVLQAKPPEGPGEPVEYLVHYAGWNARHDEWIRPGRIVGYAEDKGSVPSSPAAGSGKSTGGRPRTPLSSRSSFVLKDDIIPSPSSTYSLANEFSAMVDDLPELTVKPRVSSLLKKNLVGDFMKSVSNSTATSSSDLKRPTSPVLVSSQRAKRPKTPPVPESLLMPLIKTVKKEIEKELSVPDIVHGSDSADKDAEKPPTDSIDKKPETVDKEGIKLRKPDVPTKEEEITEGSTDADANEKKDERDRSVSPSEESMSSVGDTPEDTPSEPRAETPTQQVRRTSSRRSKSPAYLAESAWFPTKRKKYSVASAGKSPSPCPVAEKKETPQKPDPAEDSSTLNTQRSTSPTPSTQSSTSSSSSSSSSEEVSLRSKDASPVLSTTVTKVSKPRVKLRRKVPDKTENPQDAKKIPDGEKRKAENSETTEYDNFDEEAPSIALEKHHETEEPTTKHEAMENLTEENNSKSSIAEEKTQTPPETSSKTEGKSTAKKGDTGKRKMRKRRTTNGGNETQPKEPEPKPKTVEVVPTQEDDTVSQPVQQDITQSQEEKNNETQPPERDDASETPSSSNHDNADASLDIPSPSENPPSSSKVLLENTPPTTPEQSPNYISEDQDTGPEKSSPNLYSDTMDITEEHKDSAGNTSSSGCEQPTSSEKLLESLANAEEGDKDDKEKIPSSPPAKKKRRSTSRKRRNSKGRGSRRSSYTNEQDSESEEEQDDETGETNHRKRHDSRGKPRKKRTKARPEPPSAPPPLPREKLESMSQDERIAVLQARMAEMRQVYHQLKQEVANIDRKRKRAKRREKEAAEAAQSSSKRGPSPFMPAKVASSVASKVEAIAAPIASTVAAGQAVDQGNTKLEEST